MIYKFYVLLRQGNNIIFPVKAAISPYGGGANYAQSMPAFFGGTVFKDYGNHAHWINNDRAGLFTACWDAFNGAAVGQVVAAQNNFIQNCQPDPPAQPLAQPRASLSQELGQESQHYVYFHNAGAVSNFHFIYMAVMNDGFYNEQRYLFFVTDHWSWNGAPYFLNNNDYFEMQRIYNISANIFLPLVGAVGNANPYLCGGQNVNMINPNANNLGMRNQWFASHTKDAFNAAISWINNNPPLVAPNPIPEPALYPVAAPANNPVPAPLPIIAAVPPLQPGQAPPALQPLNQPPPEPLQVPCYYLALAPQQMHGGSRPKHLIEREGYEKQRPKVKVSKGRYY